jgi:hypothetical protein
MNTNIALSLFRIAVAVLLISATTSAQLFRSTAKTGTTAAQFLKIGVGSRAAAMGGAQAGTLTDLSAMYWNPAGLSRLNVGSELALTHVNWLADITYDFVGAVVPMGSAGTFGFSVISFRVPEDLVRTVEKPEGDGRSWDAGSLAFGVSYAKNLTDRFSIGMTAKYIRENIWSESASGFAIDIGTLYLSEIPGLNLGASISNFGTKMRLEGRDLYFNLDPNNDPGSGPNNIPSQYRIGEFDIPLMFRIGIGYEVVHTSDLKVTLAADAVHPNDNTEYMNTGAEVAWSNVLYGRVGYRNLFQEDAEGSTTGGLTWGFGFHYGIVNSTVVKIDFGVVDYGRLKSVQYMTIGLSM